MFLGQCCLSEHLEPCSHLDDSDPVPWCSLLHQETPSPPSQSLFLPDKSSQRLAEISSQAQVCSVSSPLNVSQATPVTHSTQSFSRASYPCCNTNIKLLSRRCVQSECWRTRLLITKGLVFPKVSGLADLLHYISVLYFNVYYISALL